MPNIVPNNKVKELQPSVLYTNNEHIAQAYAELPTIQIQAAKNALIPRTGQKAIDQTLADVQRYTKGPLETQARNTGILTDLAKAPKVLKQNENFMLDAIQKNHNAYEYADKTLKDNADFVKKAIYTNSAVYHHLTPEQKQDKVFSDVYERKMLQDSTSRTLDGKAFAIPRHQFDDTAPMDIDRYGRAYGRLIDQTARESEDRLLQSKERAFVLTMQERTKKDPALKQELEAIEKKAWQDREPQIRHIAQTQPGYKQGVNTLLQEASRRDPELGEKLREDQKQYWQRPEQMQKVGWAEATIVQNQMKLSRGRGREEMKWDENAEKILKEAKKKVRDPSNPDSELYYLKQSSMDYIYGLVAAGRISMDDASISIGLIDSVRASSGGSGSIRAFSNDYDNGDFYQTPSESHAQSDDKRGVEEAKNKVISIVDGAENRAMPDLPFPGEDGYTEAPKRRQRPSYDDVFHSPEDYERHHEFSFKYGHK